MDCTVALPFVANRIKVAVVAPSMEILGGQAVQANRLIGCWRDDPDVDAWLVPINPVPPGVLRRLLRIKYVRTILTQLTYYPLLLRETCGRRTSSTSSPLPIFRSCWRRSPPWSSRGVGKPVVMNYRSGEAPDHLRRSAVARAILRAVDRNVVPSVFLKDVFATFGIPAVIIPNIVDVDRFRVPAPRTAAAADTVDAEFRVAIQRRVHTPGIWRCPAAVPRGHSDACWFRASRRPPSASSRGTLGLRNVAFAGRVPPDEIWRYYADADIYLQTPDIDNMPASVLEAFASGCAVVSTDAGGVPARPDPRRHGLLVARNDHARAAQSVLRDR